jgi:hypothetical protein
MQQVNIPQEAMFLGRAGLARALGCSEATARNLQLSGAIAPAMHVEGRPLFRAAEAQALRERRDAERNRRTAGRAA